MKISFDAIYLPLERVQNRSSIATKGLPLFHGGMMLLAEGSDTIIALDTRSLETIWKLDLSDRPNHFPYPLHLILGNGELIFSRGKTIFVCNPDDGAILSEIEAGRLGSAVFFEEQNCFYSNLSQDYFDVQSCRFQAKPLSVQKVLAATTYEEFRADDKLLAFDLSGRVLRCFDVTKQEFLWEIDIRKRPFSSDEEVDGRNVRRRVRNPIVTGGLCILPIWRNLLIAIDLETGSQLWRLESNVMFAQAVGLGPDGNLHVIDPQRYCAVNPADGQVVSEVELGDLAKSHGLSQFFSKLSFSTTHIFFSDTEGAQLLAFNLSTHQIDWRYSCETGIPMSCSPILVNGRLYTVDLNGKLYVFESGVG